ncbi:immunoglobulin superfamily member 1-like [Malaclemys terrapin pileata]|uniref:immunoglobulin superfamily member 1-like n=1 Tax=Malaclemys terrapin pileata TaxID=2991368 RepID=UPI0023A8752E|nr:immunoglobulin superfamily member 1-like [Malaclemys terrapin pileata]
MASALTILFLEPSYPKPSISLHPSAQVAPGGAVTIRCECRCAGARVLLSKAGDPDARRSMDPPRDVAAFPIRNVSRGDAGNYSCQYRTKWDPPVWSEPSDPVELVISEPGYPKPNISLHPSAGVAPGGAVTIWCECRCRGVRVLLSKAGDPDARRSMDPVGDVAEFPIRSVSRRDAGNYSCQYSTKWDPPIWSEPSDPVELVISELSFPKPSIFLSPSRRVILGGAVTVRCWGRHQNMRFLLYKVGNLNVLQDAEPAGDMAEFPIRNVSRRDAGSYSCQYSTKSDPPVWSELSDPVELVVAEPKPNISLHPSRRVALGRAVTIRCECRCREARFLLSKAGDPDTRHLMDPAGDVAEFPIRSVSRRNAGSYSCQYSIKSNPPIWSEPSDLVELVVADGTDPDGTQQPDPPMMEPEGEAAPPGRPDFTHANIARLVLGAGGLLVLGLILAEAYYSRPREVP